MGRRFVSSWILLRDLKQLARQDGDLGRFAASVLDEFSYPVDSLVWTRDGEFVDHLPSNGANGRSIESYLKLLDAVERDR